MSGNVFYKTFYHITWSTKKRSPILNDTLQQVVLDAVRNKSKDLGCLLHAVNAVEDHVHVVMEIRPSLSISQTVGQLKGISAHMINSLVGHGIRWQEGYGVVSFREKDLPTVVRYVEQQEIRHQQGRTIALLEFACHLMDIGDQSLESQTDHPALNGPG